MKTILFVLPLVCGCGLFGGETTPDKLVADADAMQQRLNATYDQTRRIYDGAQAICALIPEASQQCGDLDRAWSAFEFAYNRASDAIDLYGIGVGAADALNDLVQRFERASNDTFSLTERLVRYAAVARDTARDCVDGAQGASSPQAPSAAPPTE